MDDLSSLIDPAATPAGDDPMRPRPFRIARVRKDLADTFTLYLTALDGAPFAFRPGQFNMLYVFGVGEVPISISGDPADPAVLVHTTRAVGTVTEAMGRLKAGDVIGVRGPFGSPWPIEAAHGQDVVFVAGGVGLAPLRPAILAVARHRERFANALLLYGSRTPEDLLYRREMPVWRSRHDIASHVTVDRATGRWTGRVGVVTKLIRSGGFDHRHAVAYVCGPEVMMRYAVQALDAVGVTADRVYVSMERNMKCGIGLCGHCQLGPHFVCRDGPVYRFDRLGPLFDIWEL